MRGRSVRAAMLLAALALAGCETRYSQYLQWTPSEKDGRVMLNAPELGGATRRTLVREAPNYYADEELSLWYRDQSAPPQAQVIRRTLSPGRYFITLPELKDVIGDFGRSTGLAVQLGAEGRTVNALGPVDYQLFRLGEADCIQFREVTGSAVRQPSSFAVPSGNTLLLGYYCAAPGVAMPPEQRRDILQSLDLKPER